jgi:hypothetical protein
MKKWHLPKHKYTPPNQITVSSVRYFDQQSSTVALGALKITTENPNF